MKPLSDRFTWAQVGLRKCQLLLQKKHPGVRMSAERPSQTTWSDPNLPWAQFLEHRPLPFNMESCPHAESEMVLVLPWQTTDMKINSHALHYQPQLASPVLPELSVLWVLVGKVSAKRAGQLGLCWNDSTNSRPPAQGHTCNYDLRHRPARGLGNTLQGSGFRIQGCKGLKQMFYP